MVTLKIFLLFVLNKFVFSLKNKMNNKYNIIQNKENLRSLQLIQNIPVDNNIPIIVQDINRDNKNPNIIENNPIPIHIPMITDLNKPLNIITNTSIKINNTNKDPMCTPECLAGCEVQFQKLVLQKNCIINICKCQIIEINSEIVNETFVNNNIKEEKILMSIFNNNDKFKNISDEFPYTYYFFILFFFVIYEIYIVYKLSNKGFVFNNEFVINKDKEKRIKDYLDLLYEDEELIECLI